MDIYEYGLIGLFVICFIASSLWPLGSEAFVIGFLVFGFDSFIVLMVASIGNTLGSLSTYYIAYFGGDVTIKKYFPKAYDKFDKYRIYIKKYAIACAFFSFLPFIGDILVLLLGAYRYNQYLSCIFIFIGKLSRYALLIYMYELYGVKL